MKRRKDPLAGLRLLAQARPHDSGVLVSQHIKLRNAFYRLCAGEADTDDFDNVAMSLNIAKIRAYQIHKDLADVVAAAQVALGAVQQRYVKWQKWQVLGAERESIADGITAYEQIADASSPLQMRNAMKVVIRNLKGLK